MVADAGNLVTHTGGCHCGRVRFEVTAPAKLEVSDCNCSICNKFGYLHLIVRADQFVLVSGRGDLTTYTFNTRVAKHTFCSHCGVKSFYVPRSHPEGVSVNARCIDDGTVESMSVTPFDGRNWEGARAGLRGPPRV
ncbi:MAG: GFA family protein [Pseudomonadota bacterium]|nr:GFA family protein [Pseudomonadota bacterium]